MASAQDTPSKKRVAWTPELNQQLLVALINTLEPSAIDYAKVAEKLGEGFSRDTVYKRIYDMKKKDINKAERSTAKKANDAITTPKKRKVASEANEVF